MKKLDLEKLDEAFFEILIWALPSVVFVFAVILSFLFPTGILPKLVFAGFATFSVLILCDKMNKYTNLLK